MEIDAPAAVSDLVGEPGARLNLVLVKDMPAIDAAALPLAGNLTEEVQRPGAALLLHHGIMVLHPIPHAVGMAGQFEADGLVFMDGVPWHPDLDPPETATRIARMAPLLVEEVGVVVQRGPGRRGKWGVAADVLGTDVDGVAHGIGGGVFGRVPFPGLGLALGAHAPPAAGAVGDQRIAGGIDKERGSQDHFDFGGEGACHQGRDAPGWNARRTLEVALVGVGRNFHLVGAVHEHPDHCCVEMEGEVRFTGNEVVEHLVEDGVGPSAVMDDRLVIAETFLPLDLGDEAGLPCPDMVAAGAMRGDANLRRGVAAEHGALLHQAGFQPAACRGKGRADSGKAAAGDDEIEGLFDMLTH